VVAVAKSGLEVKHSGFSSTPDIFGGLFDNFAVHHRDTAQTEICWGSKGPFGIVIGIGEGNSVVESDISVHGTSSAEGTVGDFGHRADKLLAVTFLSFSVGDNLSEFLEIFSNIGFPLSGSNEDSGISQWESWK
jgi:hypothetical protein